MSNKIKSLLIFIFLFNIAQQVKAELSLVENFKLNGDFRYRHEWINEQSKTARNRQRMRARVGAKYDISSHIQFGLQLASGSSNPVSTNQTQGDSFSTKPIGIDLAYMRLRPNRYPLKIIVGKQKLPYHRPGKSELIWDSDLRPEGILLGLSPKASWGTLKWNIAGYSIDERSSGDDTWLLGTDFKTKIPWNKARSHISIGVGYFDYTHTKGQKTFFNRINSFGNSTDSSHQYATNFRLFEISIEYYFHLAESPVTIFGDYVKNTTIGYHDSGWLAGARFGKIKKAGDTSFRYNLRRVEKDAVLGVFSDSDFNKGNTNGKGHEVGVDVALFKSMKIGLTFFANSTSVSKSADYYRAQADLALRF